MSISRKQDPTPERNEAAAGAAADTSSEAGALLGSSGFLLARLGAESRRQFARLLDRHDLSMHHFALLLALGERDGIPQQTVSALVGVDPRNVVPLVDELENRGLIARRSDLADRRRYKIALTREGHRKMNALRVAGAALEDEMLKALSAEERARLHALLVKLFTALEAAATG